MNLQPSEIDTGFITFCGIFPFSTDDFIDKYPCNSNAPYGDWWQHLMSNGSDFFLEPITTLTLQTSSFPTNVQINNHRKKKISHIFT